MRTTPLNLLDELYLHLDSQTEPWVVHHEVRVGGRLDAERLAGALGKAVQRHPIARARLHDWRYADFGYDWDVVEDLSEVPLRIADCADDAAFADARERHFSFSPSLDSAPPFDVLLAHVPSGDAIVLNVNHAAADGVGAARLMLSILRAYGRVEDPMPPVDPLAVRDVRDLTRAPSAADRRRRAWAMTRHAARQTVPATRVARDGGDDRPASGFELMSLSADETRLVRDRRTPGTTVNDVLLAALALTIARWNESHGKDAQRMALTMPVNLRPAAWRNDVVSNFASWATVSLRGDEQDDLAQTVALAGEQTETIKREQLSGLIVDLLDRLGMLSVGLKRRLPDLIGLTGDVVVDTASLSNLGIVDEPPHLGDEAGAVESMWFSQPGRMPLGTCIGVLTVHGRLHVTLRYRHAQFDRSAARVFLRLYRDALLT